MTVDLHCHTKISDNTLTVTEVIQLAKTKELSHLAITDHDTTRGLKDAEETGKELGIEIIPGIEISAYDYKRNRRAHLLGYYIEPNHPAIEQLCGPLIEARHECSKQMVEKVIEAGYKISWKQVEAYAEGGTGVYKQHIMHALMEAGYTDDIYSSLYKKLFSRGNANQEPGIAFVPLTYLDIFDAIEAVTEAGGIPVIAHPQQFDNFEAIPEWVDAGLKGIEVYHPDHSPEVEQLCKEYADRYDLVMTGGSDFHGFYGPTELGSKNPGISSVESLKRMKIGNK